jgi:hypothetical protein
VREDQTKLSRRDFIRGAAGTAAVGAAAASPILGEKTEAAEKVTETAAVATPMAKPLPSIRLGSYRLSRLVAGANPLNGGSYQGAHATHCMKEYFTPERKVEFLQKCERAGITAHQFSSYKNSEYVRVARDYGVKMSFFGLHSDISTVKDAIKSVQPIALVHHGGATDRLFAQGKHQQVHDFVKAVHDGGVMAGVSAHNPDCIKRIADEGWDVDFFMGCFYFLTRERVPGAMEKVPPVCTLDMTHYTFYKNDPAAMTAVIRQVQQPCFGFKILAAGRACLNERRVREAFKIAFSSLKPIDGVIVGMFPRYVDEIRLNVEAARRYGRIGEGDRQTS